jgi:hypothetical protein
MLLEDRLLVGVLSGLMRAHSAEDTTVAAAALALVATLSRHPRGPEDLLHSGCSISLATTLLRRIPPCATADALQVRHPCSP